ncbi:hypothetical protein F383_18855 [Gossypium arboreum]|uniref:Uncharacterized protein n=1 Tax=Gossypium arboreum TaxID=29729 RepID=A0A0B0NLM1_GOSAR|nr:hypothetical protein F383_18855 [Gossypium arboreum]
MDGIVAASSFPLLVLLLLFSHPIKLIKISFYLFPILRKEAG